MGNVPNAAITLTKVDCRTRQVTLPWALSWWPWFYYFPANKYGPQWRMTEFGLVIVDAIKRLGTEFVPLRVWGRQLQIYVHGRQWEYADSVRVAEALQALCNKR